MYMFIPILTYAYEVITVTKSDLCKLENMVNYCVNFFSIYDDVNVETIRMLASVLESRTNR